MFERFSADARSAVVRAQVIARETRAGRVEPAHLALAVAGDTRSAGARVLTDLGVDMDGLGDEIRRRAQHRDDLGGLTAADVDALWSLGVDATELIGRLGVPAGEAGSTGRDASTPAWRPWVRSRPPVVGVQRIPPAARRGAAVNKGLLLLYDFSAIRAAKLASRNFSRLGQPESRPHRTGAYNPWRPRPN